jgi:hypothetical protein
LYQFSVFACLAQNSSRLEVQISHLVLRFFHQTFGFLLAILSFIDYEIVITGEDDPSNLWFSGQAPDTKKSLKN